MSHAAMSNTTTRHTVALPQQQLQFEAPAVGLDGRPRAVKTHRPRRRRAPASKRRMLDGFLLLDSCHVEFPDEATRVVLQGMDLRDVAGEDLQYFTNLTFADLGDNRIELESLSDLPALEELHLHCNALTVIAPVRDGTFVNLSVLNLSYNLLSAEAVGSLATLQSLRELDLTCNSLRSLPASFDAFERLEVLSLESNKLESDACVLSLSTAPRLRELNLSYNFLRRVPESVVEQGGFPVLEWLNLAHNCIASEEDLVCLVDLSALAQVILYGNPIGTGKREMPVLNMQQVEGKVINLVTDPPDLRKRKTGRGSYAHFRVARVVEPPILSASQWRASGNRQLFGPAGDAVGPSMTAEEELFGAEDNHDDGARHRVPSGVATSRPSGASRGETGPSVFLTAPNLFGDYDDDAREDDGGHGDEWGAGFATPQAREAAADLRLGMGTTARRPAEPPDPTKLRLAVNSLRYALKHPLTSHSSIADEANGFGEPHFMKLTAMQKARMKPRIPYVPRPSRHAQPPSKEGQESTLSQIEHVLDRMKSRMTSVEGELSAHAEREDQALAGLIGAVNSVMHTFDDPEADLVSESKNGASRGADYEGKLGGTESKAPIA